MLRLVRQLAIAGAMFGCFCVLESRAGAQESLPDIRSVVADLEVPPMLEGSPTPGKRVLVTISEGLYYCLYLPSNFDASKRHPMIVEFAGNGGYRSKYGDVSEGVPEGSNLGFGISGGKDFVWLCLPFVTEKDRVVAKQWWGSSPDFSPVPTVELTKHVVASVIEDYGVDKDAIVLAGFSRGAIACNFIGLHDEEIADIWCGMVPYSHYDGVRDWGLRGTDREAAKVRLQRLREMPQFICHEGTERSAEKSKDAFRGLAATRKYLESTGVAVNVQMRATGFRNHNDAWVLRPSETRRALRLWLSQIESVQAALERLE
ncbi:MAG: hypothetical protein AAF483_01955 [Planctomycetota bacterium]